MAARKPVPPPEGARVLRDLVYARVGPANRPLRLDLYLPEREPSSPLPLVLWLHGGGWFGGSKEATPAPRLVAHGYAVASIEYRLSGEALFPAQIADCRAAVRHLRAHCDDYDLDSDRFGAWGSSAGGHLAALLGLAPHMTAWDAEHDDALRDVSCGIQAVCDWYGPSDLVARDAAGGDAGSPASRLIGGPVQANREKATAASPVTYVSPGAPPFLIMHGDRDTLVPLAQSETLYAALRQAGVPACLDVLPGAGHGLRAFQTDAVFERVAAFFDRCLAPR